MAMRFRNLDLNTLIALDALLTETNVTRAADRLNMAQTTMSGILARLRAHFDDALLVRSGRHLVPTAFAERMRHPVRSLVLQLETLALGRLDVEPALMRGNYSVLALDAIHTIFSTRVCRRLAHEAPDIALSLVQLSSFADNRRLASNDIQLVVGPSFAIDANQPSVSLFEEDLVCIASRDNRTIGDTITLTDFLAAKHVLPRAAAASGFESSETTMLRLMGHPRLTGVSTTSYLLMPELVADSDFIATMPRRLAMLTNPALNLRVHELPYDVPPISIHLQWHRASEMDPSIRWLRALFIDVSRELR